MCGIAGAIWNSPAAALADDQLAHMLAQLTHRGPDGRGAYRSEFYRREPYDPVPGVALGHRRLAIIDLATGGQPLANENDTVWITFNGEIYNFRALRNRLEGSGHKFKTAGDTETIVHLYEDEGLECCTHLNGMFAFALFDSRHRRLVLARDRLGKKPLYYYATPERLLFASELKALLAVPGVPRELDAGAIDEYLTYQYIPHPNTIWRGIKKLPPGNIATWCDGRLDVKPYWRPDFNVERARPEAEYVEELAALFRSSVEMRLESDVPLGAFLSGGVDSSLVVALMRQLRAEPVKTFTIGFHEAEYDERAYAREVAEHLGADHTELALEPKAAEILPQLVRTFDEPFADSSALPVWYVSQLAHEHVKVALTGDGGDELFAGYERYRAVRLAGTIDRLPPVRALLAARIWQRLPSSARQRSFLRRYKRFGEALGMSPARRYVEWISIFNETRRAELYTDDFLAQLPESDPAGFVTLAWQRAEKRDAVTAAALADVTTYLPCDLLTKVDRASMAHSLECRQPFLDYRLVELAAAMPVDLKYRRGVGKRILHKAFGKLLPERIWKRRKMGFGVPLARWFREDLKSLAHDALLGSSSHLHTLFRTDTMARLLSEHEQNRFDHSARLWALLVLELWLREWTATSR